MHNKLFSTVFSALILAGVCLAPGAGLAKSGDQANSFGMEFVLVPAGTFMMGGDGACEYKDAKPAHEVALNQDFYMTRHEITRRQWAEVMGEDVSKLKNPDHPASNMTYEEVQLFLLRLKDLEGTDAYRLPTEAEWEYAARAGSTSTHYWGEDAMVLPAYGWHYNNTSGTQPVGQLKPNAWGLHDMYGNVCEWCQDYYGKTYYQDSPEMDPAGPKADPEAVKPPPRVIRGGGWYSKPFACNSVHRSNSSGPQKFIGFRIVKEMR